MSKVGYHHKLREDKPPAPCFHCNTEPRLEEHVCCSGCHDELRCPKCNTHLAWSVPVHQTRGALTTEGEAGYGV